MALKKLFQSLSKGAAASGVSPADEAVNMVLKSENGIQRENAVLKSGDTANRVNYSSQSNTGPLNPSGTGWTAEGIGKFIVNGIYGGANAVGSAVSKVNEKVETAIKKGVFEASKRANDYKQANPTFTEPTFTGPTFTEPTYTESDIVTQARNALDTHLANKPGEYQSQWQSQLDGIISQILNRDKFSYDLNGDALYQQYKDKYIQQGKMAMGDAIGQASAMTGGYGNSYAQSVGQQAYQGQLQNLNDIVPELYQMALDKYNMEGQDLYNQYAMLGAEDDRDYGRYRDEMSDWLANRDYLTGRYDSERDYDYGKFVDDRNFDYSRFVDDRNFDYGKFVDDRNFDYGQYRDKITDKQWQKNFDEAKRQFEETMQYNKDRDKVEDERAKKNDIRLENQSSYPEPLSNGSSSGGSYSGSSGSGSGGGNKATSGITSSIRNKAASFTDNESLAEWAYELEDSGTIEQGEAAKLISEYSDKNEKSTYKDMVGSTKGWTVVSKGGINLAGIDADAKVTAPNGETMTLESLRNKLINEGMEKNDATDIIKELQDNLDITGWFMGL